MQENGVRNLVLDPQLAQKNVCSKIITFLLWDAINMIMTNKKMLAILVTTLVIPLMPSDWNL